MFSETADRDGAQALIRDARAGDGPAILSINREGAPGVSPLSRAEITTFLETSTLFRVVEDRGEVVAYVVVFDSEAVYDGEEFLWFREHYDRFLYIDQVAVAPEARRRGVAAALYADVERTAWSSGVGRLVCEVNLEPDNPTSRTFHDRRGFVRVGELRTRDARLVSLMEKRLG